MHGRADEARHIRIEKLAFEDTEPTFLKATEPLLRSDWKFHRVGAVTVENARDVASRPATSATSAAMRWSSAAAPQRVAVSGNHIHDIGGTAVAFVGRPEAVRSPLFEYHERLELGRHRPARPAPSRMSTRRTPKPSTT